MAHFITPKMIVRARGVMRYAGWEPDERVSKADYGWRRRWMISACMQRDFSTGCCWCKKTMREDVPDGHPDQLTIEHVTRLFDGGADAYDNIAVACHECNNGRHAGEHHAREDRMRNEAYRIHMTSGRRCSLVLRAIWSAAPYILPPLPVYDDGPGGLPLPYKWPEDWPYTKRENNRYRIEPVADSVL